MTATAFEKGGGYQLPTDEKRCTHTVTSDDSPNKGQRCRKYALKGTTLCRSHGGTASHIQKAAKRRVVKKELEDKALQYASRMMRQTGVDMDPATHLVSALYEAHGMKAFYGAFVAQLDEESQTQIKGGLRGVLKYSLPDDELDQLSVSSDEMLLGFNRHGEAQIHPFVEQYNLWWDKHVKAAKLCLDANIAERRVRLVEEQAHVVVKAIRGMAMELEKMFGQSVVGRPEFGQMVRRHLALASGSDVIEA